MTRKPPGFSRKQELALTALLNASTLQQASEQAGVSLRTLHRWLQDAAFTRQYRALRRETVSQAMARAQSTCVEGVESLRACLKARKAPWTAKVAAAAKLLDVATTTVRTEDLLERVRELERRFGSDKGPTLRVVA